MSTFGPKDLPFTGLDCVHFRSFVYYNKIDIYLETLFQMTLKLMTFLKFGY